jgi:hypothetical protein
VLLGREMRTSAVRIPVEIANAVSRQPTMWLERIVQTDRGMDFSRIRTTIILRLSIVIMIRNKSEMDAAAMNPGTWKLDSFLELLNETGLSILLRWAHALLRKLKINQYSFKASSLY